MQSTNAPAHNAQPVKLFSPARNRPAALAAMTTAQIFEHIHAAQKLIKHHEGIADNGDESASRYYFFIPEVAEDMATARYTITVCFAELKERKTRTNDPEPETRAPESELSRYYKSDAARFLDALAAAQL